MFILGVSCYYHDSAAVLLKDGQLIAAAEEERFSRVKHDNGYPKQAIAFCLKQAGITARDLDYVVFYEKPLVKFERILMTSLGGYPKTWRVFPEAMVAWFNEKLWVKGIIIRKLGVPQNRVLFTDHHMAHAASALFCTPYEDAAVLTIDGVGEWTTAAIGHGKADWTGAGKSSINLSGEIRFPHSLGLLYSAFTAFLGFEVNEGEYKVMGMAPYGEPRFQDKVYKLVDVSDDGSFRLNMDYFSYHYSTTRTFSRRFVDLFGEPRDPDWLFFTESSGFPPYFGERPADFDRIAERNQYYADIAASIQHCTEEIVLAMARAL